MNILPFLDILLASLIVTVAASTVVARDLFAAVVSDVAYGLLLASPQRTSDELCGRAA